MRVFAHASRFTRAGFHVLAHGSQPENVLIAGANRLKSRVMLCDFGLCAMYTEEQRGLTDFVGSPGKRPLRQRCGTVAWAASELARSGCRILRA